jgi:serine/threonine protein kinase
MGAYGPQADMWAMGCILYEILCGHKAFGRREGERNLAALHERIKKREVEFKM